MQNEQNFSNLIYEYFVMRFHFQYYSYGDFLPTIDTLCRQFSVSSQTVKSALKRMSLEGYISTRNGRNARVIFQQSKKEFADYSLRFFSERPSAFTDFYESCTLIFTPLIIEGLCRIDKKEADFLFHLADYPDSDSLLHFYCFILQKTDNQLAMNLFWESSLFLGFPYFKENLTSAVYNVSLIKRELKDLISHGMDRNKAMIRTTLLEFQKEIMTTVKSQVNEHVYPVPKKEQVHFNWRIYRDRPQICYTLATHILHHIYIGEYRGLQFLPSYEAMARQFHVSVSTVRRTISILNRIGVVSSINGIGTQIHMPDDCDGEPDFSVQAFRRNLPFYMQAFEIVLYTCQDVICNTFSAVKPDIKEEFTASLEESLEQGHCHFSVLSFFNFIANYNPLQGIREIYAKIYSLFLWGAPLRQCCRDTSDLDLALSSLTESAFRALKDNDIKKCGLVFSEFTAREYPLAKKLLNSRGIQDDELRLSPSIKLLITQYSEPESSNIP